MANNDNPSGLTPAYYQSGAPYCGQAELFYVPASDGTAIHLGDPVKLGGSADSEGVPSAIAATQGDPFVGVVVAIDPLNGAGADQQNATIYRAASTERYLWVATDPDILFEVQEDSAGGALAAANVGQNVELTGYSSGSNTTGLSAIELDSSTAATTATHDVQLIRLVRRADNEIGTNARWLVKLNNHQYVDGATGV